MVVVLPQRAIWEKAGPAITTVDPADIRGLVTTLLMSVRRLPRSRHEGRREPPLNALEGCATPGPRPFPEPAEVEWRLGCEGDLLGDGPHEGDEFAGDG